MTEIINGIEVEKCKSCGKYSRSKNLKDCPCCGGRAYIVKMTSLDPDSHGLYVKCDFCGLRTREYFPMIDDLWSALHAWNKRCK